MQVPAGNDEFLVASDAGLSCMVVVWCTTRFDFMPVLATHTRKGRGWKGVKGKTKCCGAE
jgi:hypothetical protein